MEGRTNEPRPRASDLTQTTPGHDAEATQPATPPGSDSRGSDPSGGSFGSSSFDHGRFLPGTVLAERYRIVELLGKGGMGEVYRADDLRLGQMVALKFLTSAQIGAINALHQEVRVARQVAHPNVCRVYDIGNVDGLPFISMEYIDGEHLGSLLKRIGRLPEDKAAEIAAQLCLGLSAIHEQGLIHRDLKPTNVMIDGRGKVRITDFGLAGVAVDLATSRERAGTPAYMAPEQIAGRGVSVRSDVYSLGLVLYELFTGKRAFEGKSWADFVRIHDTHTPVSPTRIVERLDPAIERAIMRCLEKDAALRPASALAVALALPGGDPLRAALAAGELPTPEAVAAAKAPGALPSGVALALFASCLVAIPLIGWMQHKAFLVSHTPLPKPPAVLADRAREMLSALGYTEKPFDARWGFTPLAGYREWLQTRDRSPNRWGPLINDQPPAIVFWYRESPQWLAPNGMVNGTMVNDPPLATEGMLRMLLSPNAKLESFTAVPRRAVPTSAPGETLNWSLLLEFAGLREASLQPSEPAFVPPFYCDQMRTWVGAHPSLPELPITVNAGALFGRIVFFDIRYGWEDQKAVARPIAATAEDLMAIVNVVLLVIAIGGAALLAWRNVSLGRSDRAGGWRVAVVIAGATLTGWLASADHFPSGQLEMQLLVTAGGIALLRGALAWMLYMALEPAVRRRSPETLIGWKRLLNGRFRDPTVGRDLLIGVAVGCLLAMVAASRMPLGAAFGFPPPAPAHGMLMMIPRMRDALYPLIDGIAWAVSPAMIFLTLIVLMLILVRSRIIAVNVVYAIATLVAAFVAWHSSEQRPIVAAVTIVFCTLLTIALVRGGLLVQVTAMYAQNMIGVFIMWVDPGVWYLPTICVGYFTVITLAAYAMVISIGGRPLLRADFLDR
ncbi:MAG: serine/threonine protein kinase [Phycisphaerales bacterium]|nr:serine/threonine protein kinase [Phycisphaerales bacterium]